MKTEAIRLCIQAQYGKEDYAEARKELNALLARLEELEAAQQSMHLTCFPQCKRCEYNPCDLANNSDYCPARR